MSKLDDIRKMREAKYERQNATTLIFHGSADNFVPVDQSRALTAEMKYIGANVTYIETTGQHALAGLTWPQRRLLFQQIVNFAKLGHP